MKVKRYLAKDEWYPVYMLSKTGRQIEISADKLDTWHRIFTEFERMQDEMRELYYEETD